MNFDFDVWLVIGFLAVTLFVGMGHGKSVKTIKDYALGGRNFSTGVLVATIVATWVSGSGFYSKLTNIYSQGLSYIIVASGMSLSFFIPAYVFIPKMKNFLGKTSIAEAMGDIYGDSIRVIISIAGVIGSAGFIAVQFKVFGNVYGSFFGMSPMVAIIITGLIATIYSAFGGIKSVTYTDLVQFVAFGCLIPLLGVMIWDQTYGTDFSLIEALKHPKFDYNTVLSLDNPELWSLIALFCYFALPGVQPAWFQRVSMGRDIQQAKKAMIISGFLILIITLAMAWIPFLLFSISPDLDPSNLVPYIITNYTTPGVTGLVIIVVTAMAMSTADSYINASSVLFANDFCKPLNIGRNNDIFISRIFALFLGAGAITLSFTEKDLLKIVLFANSFYVPIATPLIFVTILGFRTSTKSVLVGMGAGFAITVYWKFASIKADGIVFSMLVNLLFLFGSHYLLRQPGGWIAVQKSEDSQNTNKETWITKIRGFKLSNFLKDNAPTNELTYTGLGIYLVIYTITTMYASQEFSLRENGRIIVTIYQTMMVSGVMLSMYPIWPKAIKKDIVAQISWQLVIFVTLVCYSIFFVMLSNFSQLQFIIFTINTLLVILLMGWKLGSIMIVMGLYSSIEFFKYYKQIDHLDFAAGSPQFIFMYSLLLIATVILIFLKPKQEQFEEQEDTIKLLKKEADYAKREFDNFASGLVTLENQFKNKEGELKNQEKFLKEKISIQNTEILKLKGLKDEFLRNLSHESNTPLTGVLSMCDVLYTYYDKLDSAKIKQAIKDIINSGDRLKSYVNNIVDLSKLKSLTYNIEKKEVNLSKLILERPALYKKVFTDESNEQEFIYDVEDDVIVNCDLYYITQIIDNLIANAVSYGEGKPVTIRFKKESKLVEFSIIDQGIGVPKGELNTIFEEFSVSSRTSTPAGGRGVGLTLCRAAIEAHGGRIKAESDGVKGTSLSFILPLV